MSTSNKDKKANIPSSTNVSLNETIQKVKASLIPSIESHVEAFDATKDGLDFLHVKNTLLLTYLIDLTVHIRDNGNNPSALKRLNEMKIVLDKTLGLEKKLRYQIDKLLAAGATATAFASGTENNNTNAPEDPLQFRPDLKALGASDQEESDSDDEESDGSMSDNDSDDNDDDDLAAARATLGMAKIKQSNKKNDTEDDGIYRAPRLSSVPYNLDAEQKRQEKEKRAKKRMRASELAQTLRAQYGDAPEQEDIHGGGSGDFGRQREAARRLAQLDAEKIQHEEDAMIRLTTSRKEKKERKRLQREESSNLVSIANLNNITGAFGLNDKNDDDDDNNRNFRDDMPKAMMEHKTRYSNGKRRKVNDFGEKLSNKKKGIQAKNHYQAALLGTEGKSRKKKNKAKAKGRY